MTPRLHAATARRRRFLRFAARLRSLSGAQRWLVYFATTGLPGFVIFRTWGWPASILYELVFWIPQQRFFDWLHLAETLPYADTLPTRSPRARPDPLSAEV